jgi:cell division protein FtsL
MLRFFNIILVLVSLGAAFVLYSLEHATRGVEREIAQINRQIADERETMKLLAAEWSNLTQPARLQQLAEKHLELKPMSLLQLAEPQELAARLPERPVAIPDETSKDPIADILKAME